MTPSVWRASSPGLALLLACVVAAPSSAQLGRDEADPVIASAAEADALYESRRSAESLVMLDWLLEQAPDSYELLWRASRSAFGLGVLEPISQVRDQLYARSIGYAEAAIEVDAGRAEGHYWRAAAKGRVALHAGIAEKAELAEDIRASAVRVLEIDSLHAGAHHVLGKLHFEIMDLSGFKRWMARSFMGNEMLNNPSWERARFQLEKAVALDSTVPVYRLDLAHLYRERDEDSAAREQLLALLALEPRDPFDLELQEEAREILARLSAG